MCFRTKPGMVEPCTIMDFSKGAEQILCFDVVIFHKIPGANPTKLFFLRKIDIFLFFAIRLDHFKLVALFS